MAGNGFIARVSGKGGKTLHSTGVHPSREHAAASAFEARPNAKSCSTCKATPTGEASHMDIQFHNRPAQKKPTKETVAVKPTAKKVVKETQSKKGMAFLIESELEKAEVVLAAKGIASKLGDIAETLSKIEANDLMPMLDSVRTALGPQAADSFSKVATAQIRQVIGAVQTGKNAIDTEVSRMETIATGGDGSDVAMGAEGVPPMGGGAGGDPAAMGDGAPMNDGMPPTDGAAPAEPPPGDASPPAPDASAPDVGASGFAGRAKKESRAQIKSGRKLNEENAADDSDFKESMNKLSALSPKCYVHAHDIADAIHNLKVSGDVRNKLLRSLGHIVAMAELEDAWDDPDSVAKMGVDTHAGDVPASEMADAPEVKSIMTDMGKLAHKVALKYSGDLNEDDMQPPSATLPPAAPPAAVAPTAPVAPVSPLAAPAKGPSPLDAPKPNKPSILTAGRVFEGRQAKAIKLLRESPHPDNVILTVFRNVLRECSNVSKAAHGTAKIFRIDVSDVVSIIREAKAMKEDAVPSLMGVPMGQPDGGTQNPNPALMSQVPQKPTAANPIAGKPNKPMTPDDMRTAKTNQDRQDAANKAANKPNQPIVAPRQPVPVQQVKPVTPQMQQQARMNDKTNQQKGKLPAMPGKIVTQSNMRTV